MEEFKNSKLIIKNIWDIEFKVIREPWTLLMDIEFILNWNWNLIDFDENNNKWKFNNIVYYNIFGNNFILEYSSINDLIKDKSIFKSKFKMIENTLFSEKKDDWNHIPEYIWEFTFNWKEFLIVKWYNKLTDEINEDLWVYKWVIINPSVYFWINKKVEWEIKKVEWDIDSIL